MTEAVADDRGQKAVEPDEEALDLLQTQPPQGT